ncbi:MAG: hypothetical protein FWF06_02590, partial [Symbiobacteriaceae bacterium]|nr:hypothetical protein [Symbiobacteriaceae bacterium]
MSVDIWRRLLHMDKRIIYFTMLLAIVAPMFVPFGLPIRISQPMTDFYNTIQSMPEGSYVVIAAETSPSQMAEHRPAVMCLFRHLYERKARIIIQSVTSTQGPNLVLEWASPVINELGMEYGVDYAIPGYRTGGNATMDQARFNYIETFTDTDIYGGKLSALPIMQEFTKASDAYMVVNFHAGTTPYVNTWLATGDVSIILTAPNAVVITS